MRLFLAGAVSGNCKPLWINLFKAIGGGGDLKLYLAGCESRHWCIDEYLFSRGGQKFKYEQIENATIFGRQCSVEKRGGYDRTIKERSPNILESFFYADEWTEKTIPLVNFLLDSGAFTFFSSGKTIDWYKYLERYIAFINKNNVQHFFELDIDSIVGYQKVLEFRKILEHGTGKKPIPVWHKSRGKKVFSEMCEQYPYVAIGGIVTKEITKNEYQYFPLFINEAHRYKAKIHGLGFTNLKGLEKYHFDSVDSTCWTTGNRFGVVYKFNGKTIVKFNKPENSRLADAQKTAINNFNEWVKFSEYAEKHL